MCGLLNQVNRNMLYTLYPYLSIYLLLHHIVAKCFSWPNTVKACCLDKINFNGAVRPSLETMFFLKFLKA